MKEFVSLKDKHQVSGANVVTAAGRSVVAERLIIPGKPGAATQDVMPPASGGLPPGEEGEILYHNGTTWIVLEVPTTFTRDPVLRHNRTNAVYWDEPAIC